MAAPFHAPILLLADDVGILTAVAVALRQAGHVVLPVRHHESPIDALDRVHPRLVLAHAAHAVVDSAAFRRRITAAGARLLLFTIGASDAGAPGAAPMLHADAKTGLPHVELGATFDVAAARLAGALREIGGWPVDA